jgi:formylglycine-generating enzyme required for sulfatase activity
MFGLVPLPSAWPVYVTQEQATAYAQFRHKSLPTEAQIHRAADGASPENCDFQNWDPVPVTSGAPGFSQLIGNGWEWTSTPFDGFKGFEPMPSYPVYSSDFFDGKHFVMKGASPATMPHLIRSAFRNWFRGNYPYVYATFRCAG